MSGSPGEVDVLEELRRRQKTEGPVFPVTETELGIFDPELAERVNRRNFEDLVLPDRLRDVVRGRQSPPLPWKRVRRAWLSQMEHLTGPDSLDALDRRMERLLARRLDRPLDLVWVAHEAISRSLVPVVIDGLGERDRQRVLTDQAMKIDDLLAPDPEVVPTPSLFQRLAGVKVQIRAASAVRRELVGRAKGRRPRRRDLTDPIVDLLSELGLDRAVDAVTGVLTAIAGPPGSAASCLLYQLGRSPDWAQRLCRELGALDRRELLAGPVRAAPLTHRFVLETLRHFPPTPIVDRRVRRSVECDGVRLEPGDGYFLSSDLSHHDPRFWDHPERFDPDRWLAGSGRGPRCPAAYVPFGWAPRSCLGASLALPQLILFCHLVSTRFEIRLDRPDEARMSVASLHLPRNLHGSIRHRKEVISNGEARHCGQDRPRRPHPGDS